MKTSRIFYLTFSFVSLMILSACSEDPDEVVSTLVGDYVITKATLTEPLTLVTNEEVPLPIPVETPITPMIQEALLGAIECSTPEKTLIELREDNSMFFSCKDSDEELNAGTWEEVSETVINLNLNSTAVPSPTGVVLTVKDVVIEGDVLSGITTVLLPREMLASVVATMSGGQFSLNMEETPVAVPATFMIELTKQ